MPDLYALTEYTLPKALHGSDAEYSIRTLSDRERLSIEDFFFRSERKVILRPEMTAVIVPQGQTAGATMEDFAILVEFALGVLSVSGFEPVTIVAALSSSVCSDALQRSYNVTSGPPKFPKKLVKSAASTWLRHFFSARHKAKDKLHITAERFVRYLRTDDARDAFVDLCICLESLIESNTEISFRFATCLAKVSGLDKAQEISELLGDLYGLRSKVVHGSDSTKEHRKVEPKSTELRRIARAILTTYILFMTERTKDDWRKHLRTSLFA